MIVRTRKYLQRVSIISVNGKMTECEKTDFEQDLKKNKTYEQISVVLSQFLFC